MNWIGSFLGEWLFKFCVLLELPVYLVTVVVEGEQKQRLQNQINASGSRTKLSTSWPSFWRIHANTRLSHWVTDCLGMIIGIDDNDGLYSNNGLTKVPVFTV